MFKRFDVRNFIKRDKDDAGGSSEPSQTEFMDDMLGGAAREEADAGADGDGDGAGNDDGVEGEGQDDLGGDGEGQDDDQGGNDQSAQGQDQNQTSAEDALRQTISQMAGQIAALTEQLSQLTQGQNQQQIWPAQQAQGQAPAQAAQGQAQQAGAQDATQQQPQSYLTEEELDQIIDNPALILTAIQRAQQDVVRQIGTNLPSLVNQMVSQQVLVQSAVTEFYDANADLRPHADYVKFTMREIETQHKDKTYAEIFQITADECRKRLGLPQPNQSGAPRTRQQPSSQQRPAFAGNKRQGTNRPASKKSDLFDPAAADMLS